MKDEAVDSNPFQQGERDLAFHGSYLYDAKVQKVESSSEGWRYYIHYPGWNKNWDEWVSATRVLKRTEVNIEKQKKLMEKLGAEKSTKPGRPSQD